MLRRVRESRPSPAPSGRSCHLTSPAAVLTSAGRGIIAAAPNPDARFGKTATAGWLVSDQPDQAERDAEGAASLRRGGTRPGRSTSIPKRENRPVPRPRFGKTPGLELAPSV